MLSSPVDCKPDKPEHGCRDRVLDAAEEVIMRDGIASFTLEAVAAEAGVSKGGLLHHYPSKDRLIESLVTRSVEGWRAECDAAIEAEPEGPGRTARALMNNCLASPAKWSEQSRRSSAVLIAAIAANPTLIKPMRDNHRRLFERLRKDGLAPGTSEAVVLAIHGLWFEWLLGLEDMNPHRLSTLHEALERALAEAPENPDAAHSTTAPSRAPRSAPASTREMKQ